MYTRINYKPSNHFYNSELNQYLTVGEEKYDRYAKQARMCLRDFILNNGSIDGSAIKDHWFNIEKADIFISHSHKDLNKVKALAGWLYYNFELTVFIDSCVWGYCDDLLKQIDDKYCKKESSNTYIYELRNYSTSHVHMMLSIALTEMIDKSECIVFYNTPKSIVLKEEIDNQNNQNSITNSPWIYQELAMSTLIKRTIPKRPSVLLEQMNYTAYANELPNIEYNVDEYLKNMIELSDDNLKNWIQQEKSNIHPLDVLYKIINPKYDDAFCVSH